MKQKKKIIIPATLLTFSLFSTLFLSTPSAQAMPEQLDIREFTRAGKNGDYVRVPSTICDTNGTGKLMNLIHLIDQIPSMSAAMEIQASDPIKETPGEFLRSRIKTFLIEEKCKPSQLAFVLPTERQTMHVCPVLFSYPLDYGSATLMHEARHIDGFPHVECTRGHWQSPNERTGVNACDPSYEEQGSYGIGVRYLLSLVKTEGISPAMVQSARSFAAADLLSRFNEAPLGITQGGLLQSEKGDISFFDGEANHLFSQAPADSLLIGAEPYQYQGIISFNRTDKKVVSTDFHHRETALSENDALVKIFHSKYQSEIIDLADQADRNPLNPICFLTENVLGCLYRENKVIIPVQGFRPVGFVRTSTSYLLKPQVLYIASADGDLYEVPSSYPELSKIKSTSRLVKIKAKHEMMSMIGWKNGGDLGVRLDGSVWSYDPDSRSWSKLSVGEPGEKFKKVIGPYYWSQRLQDL